MAKSRSVFGLRKRSKDAPQKDNNPGPAPKSNKSISAFIDVNTEFEGHLKFEGTMHLDGRFKGEINAAGGLIIGKKAIVKADIRAAEVNISGEVTGNIEANKKIEIQTGGKVIGDIKSTNIIVHPGAVLVGNCLTSLPAPKPIEIAPKPKPKIKPAAAPEPEIKLETTPKPEIKLEAEPGIKPKPVSKTDSKKKNTRFKPV